MNKATAIQALNDLAGCGCCRIDSTAYKALGLKYTGKYEDRDDLMAMILDAYRSGELPGTHRYSGEESNND